MVADENSLKQSPQHDWAFGTAEGSRRAVLEAGSKTSFREKHLWLELAESLCLRMRKSRPERGFNESKSHET